MLQWQVLHPQALYAGIFRFLEFFPYFFFLITAFLSLKIQKTQIFFISLFYVIIYSYFAFGGTIPQKFLTFLLPLVLTWITMLKTVRFFSRHTLFQVVGIFVVCALGYYVSIYLAEPHAKFLVNFVKNMQAAAWMKFWKLPSLMFFFIPFLFLISLNFRHKALDLFFPASWLSLLPILYAINQYPTLSKDQFAVLFSGVGLLILYSMYQYFISKVYKDELTGALNRRALDERLETLHDEYTIAMMDVDHFKQFNDTYGHKEGDNVLRYVALYLTQKLSTPVYRYGGEEFCAIFENTDPVKVKQQLAELCECLSKKKFFIRRSDRDEPKPKKKVPIKSKISVYITISIGMSTKGDGSEGTPDDIRKDADMALYKAKDNGRNQVVESKSYA